MIIGKNLRKVYRVGHGEKLVFDGLDFTIAPGQKVGLLGRNGAGKSTLIKLIGGVEMPTRGTIERQMSVSWPLGFGGGFQGSLSGYDNARFIARIYGKDYRDIRDFVEDFTELGRQLRMPVKTYSSGMRARLAFALSLVIEFDCYMIDEIILVGDQNFQRKCHHELFEKRADRALLVASHSADVIREYCDSALVLDACRGTMYTDVDAALERYNNL